MTETKTGRQSRRARRFGASWRGRERGKLLEGIPSLGLGAVCPLSHLRCGCGGVAGGIIAFIIHRRRTWGLDAVVGQRWAISLSNAVIPRAVSYESTWHPGILVKLPVRTDSRCRTVHRKRPIEEPSHTTRHCSVLQHCARPPLRRNEPASSKISLACLLACQRQHSHHHHRTQPEWSIIPAPPRYDAADDVIIPPVHYAVGPPLASRVAPRRWWPLWAPSGPPVARSRGRSAANHRLPTGPCLCPWLLGPGCPG